VFKKDFIVGVKIDFSDIQSQVGRPQEDLPQRLERRNDHPVKWEGHYNDEEEETHDPEDPNNGSLQSFPAHYLAPSSMEDCPLAIQRK
jgi:hypothetical protein